MKLKPYTSVFLKSEPTEELLKTIFASKIELHPRTIDKPIVLYGAGSLGKMAKAFFDYLRMPYLYFVDQNAEGAVRPGEAPESDKKRCLLITCIANLPFCSLRDELRNQGWKDIAFFYDVSEAYRGRYPLGNGWFLDKLDEKEKGLIKEVFFSLLDGASRAFYAQFLAWHMLRVELLFKGLEINTQNRFFISEVASVLKEDEVFLDCGAHHGSVTEKFLRAVKNKCKAIYAIEPDPANFLILESKLKNIPKTRLMKYALSDKGGKEKFYEGFDFASKLSKKGNVLVKTAALDSLGITATFLKMHLEGGELGALKGAINTIQKYRPIIAVTIYHSSDGAWKIPLFVIKNTENYEYIIRLHSWAGTGAVFYAIPKERGKKRL